MRKRNGNLGVATLEDQFVTKDLDYWNFDLRETNSFLDFNIKGDESTV